MILRVASLVLATLDVRTLGVALRHSWDPARYIAYVANEGGLAQEDADELVDAVAKVSGPAASTFLLTVTTRGMVDLARNMLGSLDAVPADLPRLVVGIGGHVCKNLGSFWNTVCVDLYRNSALEQQVSWGSRNYYQVVLRKHVVLSIASLAGLAKAMVFSDPDIVYFSNPAHAFERLAKDEDILFSPNNALDPDARSVKDLSADYETRGMANITLGKGKKKRRVDINSGLFYMRNSSRVNHLWMETLKIFLNQENAYGHYQQYSLVTAMATVPNVNIGVAPGDIFVNGNVFWGHRDLLKEQKVVSVHANWMASHLKRTCLDAASLWIDPTMAAARLRFSLSDDVVEMDDKAATVTSCHRRDP
jgi:hypothetical protein